MHTVNNSMRSLNNSMMSISISMRSLNNSMMSISISMRSLNNWRAGASQPSRTTGNDFSIYKWDGAHFTSAHAPNLRETPTRHVSC